jgi:hypothetical protein
MTIIIEVIGVEPPCKRCAAVEKNVKQAVEKLKNEGMDDVTVKKLDVASKDVVSKYGILLSPALAINGKVRVAGRIPTVDEIIKLVRGEVQK